MPITSFIFNYNYAAYNFTAKLLAKDLFKVKFSDPLDCYGLPQKFIINTHFVLLFLPEKPNAPYYTTQDATEFLKTFSAELKEYVLEYAK